MTFTGKVLHNGTVVLSSTKITCDVFHGLGSILPCWRGEFATAIPASLSFPAGDLYTIVRDDGKTLEVVVTGYSGKYAVLFEGSGNFQ